MPRLKQLPTIFKSADTEWGGFGNAPKFPQTFSIIIFIKALLFYRK